MAPARRRHSPNGPSSRNRYAEESDDAPTEDERPRPQKSNLKKRLSEAYVPDNDASVASEPASRVPLKNVNITADEAEKRRRRKSAKFTLPEQPVAGPSSEGQHDPSAGDASRSLGRSRQPLKSVAPPPNVTIAEMSSNFEEWMKMATDNKINATNSWEFALIDYFHDMSLLRNKDDNSINFQRASCTLDGCVKIWTSRVDSVGTETTKLLSNLASGHDSDDDEDDDENAEAGPSQKRKRPRTNNRNLAPKWDSLENKKPDLEFAVDPLFKKTCADFDEGGASGLLMNHLSLGFGGDGGMRVIFDASDSVFQQDEVEDPDEPVDLIDLSELKANYLPDLSALEGKAISHTLAGFSFDKPFNLEDSPVQVVHTNFEEDDEADDDDAPDGDGYGMDVDHTPGQVEDFFAGPDAVDDYDYAGPYGGDGFGDDDQINGSVDPEDGDGPRGPAVAFDPRSQPNGRELMLTMDPNGEDGLAYFDSKFSQNWAGPEHWKLRKTMRRADAEAPGGSKPARAKTKKEPVKIDFLVANEKSLKEMKDELFAPPGKGASINLPGTGPGRKGKKKVEKKSDHRLPDDMHFSSKQLVTLFLKPKFFLKMRGRQARINNDNGEIDDNFWAQTAAGEDLDEPAPFATQFLNDDDDDDEPGGFDVGFDDPFAAMGAPAPADEEDILAATQNQSRRIKPEAINYTRRAKRVDVRKLKDNIWRGLDITLGKPKEEGEEAMDVDDEELPEGERPTDPSEARQFSQVITGLTGSYPKERLDEISTSFCFICLLHLANERGLKLEAADEKHGIENDVPTDSIIPDDEDDAIAAGSDMKTGDLWGIKIYRDPTATQSA